MEYLEIICPQCKKIVEFKPEEKVLDCPFCDFKIERTKESRKHKSPNVDNGSEESLSDAYEEGIRKGREAERKRLANEEKTFLWVAIVLGVIGGGIVGGKVDGPPEQKILGIVIGGLVGGLAGGLHYFFGCFLTFVILIAGAIVLISYIIK